MIREPRPDGVDAAPFAIGASGRRPGDGGATRPAGYVMVAAAGAQHASIHAGEGRGADVAGADTGRAAAPPGDADFSRAVLEDLYRYPRKRVGIALLLWLFTGVVGGHRFYLDRPWTGAAMLFSAGGALLWWIVDVVLVRRMVERFNAEQAQRERTGQAPIALSFMPPLHGAELPPLPDWMAARGGRRRLFGDLVVLAVAGASVGALSSSTGNLEAVVAIGALSAITLLGARWDALASIPILRGFDRWSHRLRLFYYVNDPGGPLRLFFRPLYGLVTAPFRKRARAEAWLYLQLGIWFTLLFTGADLLQLVSIGESGLELHVLDLLLDVVITFISIYAFAAPIGAILTTHVLLQKRDRVVWLLTGVTLAAMLLGMSAAQ